MTDRSEASLTEIVDVVTHKQFDRHFAEMVKAGDVKEEDVPTWESIGLNDKRLLKQRVLMMCWDILDLLEAEPHQAKRGDEIEAWIKAARDQHHRPVIDGLDADREWDVLDNLLDNYRLHADTGTRLSEDVPDGPTDPFAGD